MLSVTMCRWEAGDYVGVADVGIWLLTKHFVIDVVQAYCTTRHITFHDIIIHALKQHPPPPDPQLPPKKRGPQ